MARVDIGLMITGTNNASGAIKGASSDVKSLGENAQATANRLKAIQVVIAGILIDKTLEWGKAIIAATAASQALESRLIAFAGSGKAAANVMETLSSKFAATPFALDGVTQSWIRMQSTINNNGKTTEVISAIVNDVAAMGGKDENIANLSESFQRLFAVGFASAREYKSMLQQVGLTVGDLAAAAGKGGIAFETELAKGFVSAQQFTDAFIAASKQKFGDYASNLKFTIAGALGNVQNSLSLGIAGLGANTTVNANISAVLNNIAEAIRKLIGSIDQQKIDAFFDWMRRVAPTAVMTGVAIFNIGAAIADMAAIVGTFTSKIPQEALEMGIVGYWLFGKKGAAILGIIGAAGAMLDKFNATPERQAQLHTLFPNIPKGTQITPGFGMGSIGAPDPKASNAFTNFFHMPTPQEIQAQLAGYQKLLDSNIKPSAPSPEISAAAAAALERAKEATQGLKDNLAQATDTTAKLVDQTSGDELLGNIDQINSAQSGFNKQVDAAIKSEQGLTVHTKENLSIVSQLKQAKQDYNRAVDDAIVKTMQEFAAGTRLLGLQSELTQMQVRYQAAMTTINANQNPAFNALSATSGGQAVMQYMQQREQLQEQLNQSQQKFNQLTDQLALNPGMDPMRAQQIRDQVNAQNDLTTATQNALGKLSVEGIALQGLWKQLGQTMENDLANGITGLLEGTMTLGDVARQVFGDMISLGVKFLLQLVEMQLFGEVAGAASLAAVGPIAAAMAAMWAPAAMAASIASYGTADAVGMEAYTAAMGSATLGSLFANGGVPGLSDFSNSVVSGPTAFNVMGEAGKEAILPLTNVGGKLGVRASGGSGGMELHFHSNDPESNVKYFMDNIDLIAAMLAQRNLLNMGNSR